MSEKRKIVFIMPCKISRETWMLVKETLELICLLIDPINSNMQSALTCLVINLYDAQCIVHDT